MVPLITTTDSFFDISYNANMVDPPPFYDVNGDDGAQAGDETAFPLTHEDGSSAVDMFLVFDFEDEDPDLLDLQAPDDGCEIISPEAGVFIVDCDEDDDKATLTYCVVEEGAEAGMFEEVCYEIDLADGCTLTSSEAGVYVVDCDEDDTVSVNPLLDNQPALTLNSNGGGVEVGLLLPAVQAAREG